VHLVAHDVGAGVGWIFAASRADHLLSFTALSTPHPTAFKQAILTSRQAITSRYVYFYQLPRIPEWCFLGRRGDAATLSRYLQSGGQTPALADRDARAMAEPGALTASMNWYRALSWSDKIGQIAVPTMYVWSDGDKWVRDKAARNTGRHVSGPYRFEILHGTSHWIPRRAARHRRPPTARMGQHPCLCMTHPKPIERRHGNPAPQGVYRDNERRIHPMRGRVVRRGRTAGWRG
jgi:pimeloyl-ACP methyl ester carboxylesterase